MRRTQSLKATLGSIVFSAEILVVFLGSLVAFGLKLVDPPVAFIGGGILCVLMIAVIPVLRFRWGLICGWVLQGVIVATGIVMPLMFVVGGLFLLMWVYCMVVGARIDREKLHQNQSGE
ncbi:Protein of unknown function [Paramicrobacterium humi]|uniref:DUF4233 domain-containing protein n=1 Tax=Paramicrobacterium humi TaxID=640635 RepID=A0A1H4Q8F7_9MICO|nr:DUF4233 domain-containing protein [Microbacterium humi]SEC15913.1 Protein of unknown function [Microbacterium humi]